MRPQKKFAVFCILAGHGIQRLGTQWILTNEYNEETKFYKMYSAEDTMRTFAENYSNSLSVGFFVCCRQNYIPSECVPKTKQLSQSEPIDDTNNAAIPIEKGKRVRGKTFAAQVKQENSAFVYGCRPDKGVLIETKMVDDLINCIMRRINPSDRSIEFPKVLDQISTHDASFEVTVSNSIQKCKLFYTENVASKHKFGLIICTTKVEHNGETETYKYKTRKRNPIKDANTAEETMKNVFGMEDVMKVVDGSESDILSMISQLQDKIDTIKINDGGAIFVNLV